VNYVVTVRPIPTVAASNTTICSGTSPAIAITNPNSVSGTTFSWTVLSSSNVTGATAGTGNLINQVLTSTDGVTSGTVTYRITPSANGCNGATTDVTVTVDPSPQITNTATQLQTEICSSASLNFTASTSIVGATLSWTSTASAEITSGVSASGSGAITDAPVNTSNVTGTVTYTITPSFNGCSGTPVNYVVVVRPLPTASVPDITMCSGQSASLNILPSPRNVVGTTFSWVATPSANVTGSSSGNGSMISQTLQTTDASIGTVQYAITPAANNCNGPVHIVTVTVNPVATVSAGADFEVCEPVSFEVKGFLGGDASSGTWTVVGPVAGTLSASTVSGTEVTATYTIGAADVTKNITFRLTTDDPDAAGPCSAVMDEVVVKINRRAVVTLPSNYTVCEPSSISLTGTLSGGATTGIWSTVATGGLSATSIVGPTPDYTAAATYAVAPADIGSVVTFRLTSNDPDGFGPCTAEFSEINITVNESAKVNAGADFAICDYEKATLNGSISGSATSAVWTKPFPATGTLVSPSTLSTDYLHTKSDLALKTLTFRLTTNDPDGSGPCTPSSDQVVLTINKLDLVDLVNLESSYAENDPIQTLIGFPNDPDEGSGVFTGPGIIAGTNRFDPGNANAGASNIITYTWTNAVTGCVNSDSDTTIVNALTVIDFYIDGNTERSMTELRICRDAGRLWIFGEPGIHDDEAKESETFFESDEIPGRILKDFNVNTGATEFYINTDGLDPNAYYTIRYQFVNKLDVKQVLTKRIRISASPTPDIVVDPACLNDEVTFRHASTIINNPEMDQIVKYTWDFDENGEGAERTAPFPVPFDDPTYSYKTPGEHFVTLTVETNNQCVASTTEIMRVGTKPFVNFAWSKICSGLETTQFSNLSATDGFSTITGYQWDFGDGTPVEPEGAPTDPFVTGGTYEDPDHAYSAYQIYDVRLTASTNDGCVADTTRQVYILNYETPQPTTGYYNDFEIQDASWVALPLPEEQKKNSWVWADINGTTITPSPKGAKGWWTGLNDPNAGHHGTYFGDEDSEVIGPCMNLQMLDRPMISFDYWSETQQGFDGVVLQYSTDGAQTWKEVGDAKGGGINWYGESFLSSSPGGQDNFAWSGSTGGWKTARYNLEQIPYAERDLVVFRFAFASNNDNPKTGPALEGFAFDNVFIGNKSKNVLVEHFTNQNVSTAAKDHFATIFSKQVLRRGVADFEVVQYHLPNPGADALNADNPVDPFSRAQWYGVSTPPTAIMDGIQGDYFGKPFTGAYNIIDSVEIDRRSLEDPLFSIVPVLDMGPGERLIGSVEFKYNGTVADASPKILQVILVEDSVGANLQMNVVRKLLWKPEGRVTTTVWNPGTTENVPINFNMATAVSDPSRLSIIAFVQDKNSKLIHQSVIAKAPVRNGVVVGLPVDPVAGVLKNLNVYPVPASSDLTLQLDEVLQSEYQWKIIDQRGAEISSGRLNRDLSKGQTIDISRIRNGVYFLCVQASDRAIFYKKIVIMNRE
jgi:hypothetical protein